MAVVLVERVGAGDADRAPPRRQTERTVRAIASPDPLVGTGLLIIAAHIVIASLSTVGFQPYTPMETFGLGGALIIHTLSVPADLAVYGILLLIGSSLAVYHRARNLAIRESRLEADLARAQLDALRLEIEPHFLFNTLNSIASLIRSRASDRALSMLLGLSELLRATVDGRQHTSTLGEETAFVKRYIDLQRVRFSDRLDVQLRHLARVRVLCRAGVSAAAAGRERVPPRRRQTIGAVQSRAVGVGRRTESCTSGFATTARGFPRISTWTTTPGRACATPAAPAAPL